MPGSTPDYGFPYPTGTDRVMDGDNAIEALARAVEDVFGGIIAIEKPATATLTLTNGPVEVPGTRYDVTTTVPEIWIVAGVWDFLTSTAAAVGNSNLGTLYWDAVTQPGQAVVDIAHVNRTAVSTFAVLAAAPGAHSLLQRAQKTTTGGAATCGHPHTRMTVLRIPVGSIALLDALRAGGGESPAMTPHAPDSEPAI